MYVCGLKNLLSYVDFPANFQGVLVYGLQIWIINRND